MMRAGLKLIATVAAGIVALTGCGGDDDNASTGDIQREIEAGNGGDATGGVDVPDACVLVTKADAESLFGEPARQKESDSLTADDDCIWTNVAADKADSVGLLLAVTVYANEASYGAQQEMYRDAESLDVGDRGFVDTEGIAGGVDVQFVKNGMTVAVSFSTIDVFVDEGQRIDPADRAEQVVALARQAAARM